MNKQNRWRGLVVGAASGVVGTLAMGAYMQATANAVGDATTSGSLDDMSLIGKHYKQGEGSTDALGRILYETLTGKAPKSEETHTVMSNLVHWGFGTSMAALYGARRAGVRFPDARGGAVFGSMVWLFASELMIPLLGLSAGPTTQPAAQHANQYAAHLVYGITVAATAQTLEALVDRG